MTFFSNLGTAISGETYLKNKLVNNKIATLLDKVQKISDSELIKHWIFASILSCHIALDYLLFAKKGEEVNTFKAHIGNLNEEKTFEIIKLLTGHYFSAFKLNTDNINFLKKLNINLENFEREIFSFFLFSDTDKILFNELDKEYNNDAAKYFLHLYQRIFEKAYGIPNEKNAFASMLLSGILTKTYTDVFLGALSEKLKENQFNI